jgi:hypothetical protein
MKEWILGRLTWMDNNMFGSCPIAGTGDKTDKNIAFYPNPTSNSLKLTGLIGDDQLIIRDVFGKIINQISVNSQSTIDLSNLQNGLYIIELLQNKITTKIILNR